MDRMGGCPRCCAAGGVISGRAGGGTTPMAVADADARRVHLRALLMIGR
jgi:hypothetical protein